MYKNWLIGILVVALAVVGYFWSATATSKNKANNDLRAARSRIATLEKTRPAGTTAAPAEATPASGVQKDPAPEGCVGCHKKTAPDKDYTVPAELKKISGHPTVAAAGPFPKVCVTCHTSSGKPAPVLATVLHKPHLTGKTYAKEYDTNCLGCHGLKDGTPYAKGLQGA